MNALHHVEAVREKYTTALANGIRTAKESGEFLASEVVITPNIPKDQLPPPDEAADAPAYMTIDLLTGTEESPKPALFMNEPQEGPLLGAISTGTIEVSVYPFLWEACRVWLRHAEPDWRPVQTWFKNWFVGTPPGASADSRRQTDVKGLLGGVHYMSDPIAEGGGYLFEVDLGSAPVEALLQLLRTLGDMGAHDVRIGLSDGSDMDASIAEGLSAPNLTSEHFVQLMSELLRDLEGVQSVKAGAPEEPMILHVTEKGLDEPYISNLANLWLMLQKTPPGSRPREVGRYLRGHLESRQYRASGNKPDLSSLRPVIKPSVFIDHIRSLSENKKEKKLALVCTRLVGDLWIACVWDRPNGMQFVTTNEPDEFGLSLEDTHARALKNYLASPRQISTEDLDGVTIARTHDNYDASLLLDDAFWNDISAKFPGTLLACVPTRDSVLISSTDTPNGEKHMRQLALEYLHSGNHAISATLLRRQKNTWQVHGPATPLPPRAPALTDSTAQPQPQPLKPPNPKKPWWKFW